MSRVFDALQESIRRRDPKDRAMDAVWSELDVAGPADKVENGASGGEGGIPEVVDAGAAKAEVLEISPENLAPRPDEAQPAIDAASTQIRLDKRARLIPHTSDPVVVERYRMLRTKILQEREQRFFRSLVVTSASPQEGKTVTVLNLALAFAALPSFRVLVVDGDMRKGTLGDWLNVDPERPGLSNLLEGSATLNQVLLKSEDLSLCVLPRGNAQICDLHPGQFDACFRPLAEHFDLVLVDTPPVNLVTDVQIMAASCDAILLIAKAFSTTGRSLEEAAEKLQPFRMIGTVLNAGTPRSSRGYQGYY
jgi:capsular exopolysaccharide synthesis family protein